MKNLNLSHTICLFFCFFLLFVSCKKEEIPEEFRNNIVVILTQESPARSYTYGYTFRGQYFFSYDPKTGQNYASCNIAELFCNREFSIGEDITARIFPSDSIHFLRAEQIKY